MQREQFNHAVAVVVDRSDRNEWIVPVSIAAVGCERMLQLEASHCYAYAHRRRETPPHSATDVLPLHSITELAEALKLDRSYVGRILRLTLLAPDIIEAILRGAEPSGLSLARLTKEIPMLWEEQRKMFTSKQIGY